MCARVFSRGFHGRREESAEDRRLPPGQYLDTDFPVLSAGPIPRHTSGLLDLLPRGRDRCAQALDLGRVSGTSPGDHHQGHPLRHPLVQARHHQVGGGEAGA